MRQKPKAFGLPLIVIGLVLMGVGIGSSLIPMSGISPSNKGYFEVAEHPVELDLDTDYSILVRYVNNIYGDTMSRYFCIGNTSHTSTVRVRPPSGTGLIVSAVGSGTRYQRDYTSFIVHTTDDPSFYGRTITWKVSMFMPTGWGSPTGGWNLTEIDYVYITVSFASPDYELETSVNNPSWGSVSPSGISNYSAGVPVLITATAKDGFRFSNWSLDIDYADRELNPLQVYMTQGKTIKAHFAPRAPYTLQTSVMSGEGTILGDGNYYEDTEAEIEAFPSVGYSFDKWGGSITGSINPTTVIMNTNKNIYAYFKEDTYDLIMNVSPVGTGTTDPEVSLVDIDTAYPANSIIILEAIPNEGHTFSGWNGDLVSEENPTTITLDSDKTITAVFDVREEPEADFSIAPSSPQIGDIVYFADLSKDFDGYVASWEWEFGSGASPSTSTSANPTCVYSIGGIKTIELTVTDDEGAVDSKIKNIDIAIVDTYTLSGYVVDDTGKSLSGVMVKAGGYNTYTDFDGYYEIEGLVNKAYAIVFTKDDYIQLFGSATISGTDVTLTVEMEKEKGFVGGINLPITMIGLVLVIGGVFATQLSDNKSLKRR